MAPPQTPPHLFLFTLFLIKTLLMSLKQLKISYLFLVNVYVFKKVVRMSCAIVPVQIKINILRQ